MCASTKPERVIENVDRLKKDIKILKDMLLKAKPELEDWIKQNF